MLILVLGAGAAALVLVGGIRVWLQVGARAFLVGAAWTVGILIVPTFLLVRCVGCELPRRAALVEEQVAGQRWLRDPGLGFSLRHPGPDYVEDHALAIQQEGGSSCEVYVSKAGISGGELMVCVADGAAPTRAAFEAQIQGAQSGIGKAAFQQMMHSAPLAATANEALSWMDSSAVQVETRDVGWANGVGSAYLRVRIGRDVRFWLKATTFDDDIAFVMVFAPDDKLAGVVASFARSDADRKSPPRSERSEPH